MTIEIIGRVIWGAIAIFLLAVTAIYLWSPVEAKVHDYRQIVREWRLRRTFGRHYGRAR